MFPRLLYLTITNRLSTRLSLLLLLACCLHACKQQEATTPKPHTSWQQYGGSGDQSKYLDLTEITKSNLKNLQVAWTYPTLDNAQYQFNPIIVDNVMYLLAKNFSLIALDATNGKELWIHAGLNGITWKGVNYWESKDRKDRRLIFTLGSTLQEIDALTGKSILSFGKNGYVNLKEGLDRDTSLFSRIQPTTPGVVYDSLIMLGSSPGENLFSGPGHVRAYNIITGKLAWVFHTIPLPGETGYDTWPKDAYKYVGGVNTWGEISVDDQRGIVYFPTGSPTYDYYGADRIGDNLFSDCILALDAKTGKRLWHFQTVHHDLWDYDLCAAPQLITVTHNGKKIDAVAQASKTGFLYVFNRVTGEPLWPIEERAVPQSTIPGEKTSPTQPFPTVVPPFGRQGISSKDVSPYLLTKDEQDSWRRKLDSSGTGMFQPLSLNRETIALPGAVGGANFGTTAADPTKGLVYVINQDYPSVYKVWKFSEKQKSDQADQTARAQSVYIQSCKSCHGENKKGAIGPDISTAATRLDIEKFKSLIATGKGQMPGFPHISESEISDLYAYLGGPAGMRRQRSNNPDTTPIAGPVVAKGGAPAAGALAFFPRGGTGMKDYPEGVTPPTERYISDNGLAYPYLITPPWSYIVAYDLNKGVIKWKASLGQDKEVTKQGGKNTGVPGGGQRKGMIVTSTGILFSTAKDSRIYAFDTDNGNELWSADLPGGTEGLPSMYAVNGKQYLVVSVTAPNSVGKDRSQKPKPKGVYVVYALPGK